MAKTTTELLDELSDGGLCLGYRQELEKKFFDLENINTILLEAAKASYLKHHLNSDIIGWDELSSLLLTALCQVLGDKGYQDWVDSVER